LEQALLLLTIEAFLVSFARLAVKVPVAVVVVVEPMPPTLVFPSTFLLSFYSPSNVCPNWWHIHTIT